jgi:hypothetical protein
VTSPGVPRSKTLAQFILAPAPAGVQPLVLPAASCDAGIGLPPPKCRRCGETSPPKLSWQPFVDGTRHIRVTCGGCGRFIRYAAQTPEVVAAAHAEVDRLGL